MRFLQPLEDFSSNFLDTHYLGFEVYYRRRRFRSKARRELDLRHRFSSRKMSADATMLETNEEIRRRQRQTSLVPDEVPETK